jgi:hypothetical protein
MSYAFYQFYMTNIGVFFIVYLTFSGMEPVALIVWYKETFMFSGSMNRAIKVDEA